MPHQILFVVGQSATVAYLAPLWRNWLSRKEPAGWKVLAAKPAAERAEYERLVGLPMTVIESDDIKDIEEVLSGWTAECVIMSASFAPVERAAVAFARRHRVPLARIVDTWYGYRRRLENPAGILELPDRLLVIDREAAAEAVAEGIPPDIVEVVGQPAWENVRILPPGDRRDVLFVSQPIERYYGMSLGYTEKTVWQLFYQTVQAYPHLVRQILYAPHPEDDMPPPGMPGVTVVESGLLSLPAVGSVVGMFSSLVTDALLSGRHVVSFQPGASGRNMCAMGRTGLVPRAMTPGELKVALSVASPDVTALREMLEGSNARVEAFCRTFAAAGGDAAATRRAVSDA